MIDAAETRGADGRVVERARALAPRIREAADGIEAAQRLPTELYDEMADADLFRLFAPKTYGGLEAHPLTALLAIEEIARADGSAGWLVTIGSFGSLFLAWLPQDVVLAMTDPDGHLRVAGNLRPLGQAREVDGGYVVSGRWDFCSGIYHASWMSVACTVMDEDEPRLNKNGEPVVRAVYVPTSAGDVIDNWSVTGLRGTGSSDFAARNVFVPSERTWWMSDAPLVNGPLYLSDHPYLWVAVANAGTPLGIARGAIDEFTALARRMASTSSTALLRDRPHVQSAAAEAEAIVNAARAYLIEAIRNAWDAVTGGQTEASTSLAHVFLSSAHATHESVRALDLLFRAAGTNAVRTQNRLERFFRDVHVVEQGPSGGPGVYEFIGRRLLGVEPMDASE